jgi:predicted enzyme related to lactoylglutathione lyase
MSSQTERTAELKVVVTNTLIVRDIQPSVAFYRDVLGASVLRNASRHSFASTIFGSRSTAEAERPRISGVVASPPA